MNTRGRHQRGTITGFKIWSGAPGDVTIATELGIPRSTARGWLGKGPNVVVGLDVTNLSTLELQREVLVLRRRVKRLGAPLGSQLRCFECRDSD